MLKSTRRCLLCSTASFLTAAAPPPEREHITVHAQVPIGADPHYAQGPVMLGPLGRRRALDTPLSVTTIPRDLITNQQARNVNDLVAYLPSVQLEERGDPNTSRPQTRGFEADVIANSRVDGLNMVITTPYAAEQFDSLQVLSGLSGALYGPQNPAGTFDYTLKRPTDRRIERLTVGVDSNGAPLESADVSGRLGWFGYRVNLLNQTGESYVSGSHLRRNLFSGDFDVHLDERTVLQFDVSQYTFAERGLPGQFAYGPRVMLPSAPDVSRPGYGQRQGGFNAATTTVLAKIIHHFNADWSLTLGGLYQNAYRDVFTVANTFTGRGDSYVQAISAAASAKTFKAGSNTAYLNGRFYIGSMKNDVVIGSNGYMIGNYNPQTAQSFTLGSASLAAPKVVSGPQPHMSGSYKSADTTNQSLLVGDTVTLTKRISVMGTLAWSWLSSNNYTKSGQKIATYSRAAAFSPMTSIIIRPTATQSVYATWGQAIQAGPIAPVGSTNVNQALAPLRSEEYEIGYKWQVQPNLLLSVAGFRMTRPFAYTNPTSHVFGTFGNQRNYGMEFQASGNLTHNFSVFGGIAWLDPQVGNTGISTTSNKTVVGAPPVQVNLLFDYRLSVLPGTALTVTFHYTGRRAANVSNTTFAADYYTVDLGARYAFHVHDVPLVARFGVQNVGNTRYWASVYPSSINGGGSASNAAVAGLPRTFHGTIAVDF